MNECGGSSDISMLAASFVKSHQACCVLPSYYLTSKVVLLEANANPTPPALHNTGKLLVTTKRKSGADWTEFEKYWRGLTFPPETNIFPFI
eukprot:scaffold1399_cov109-Cylindrotheca_fusiformis.AAC.2